MVGHIGTVGHGRGIVQCGYQGYMRGELTELGAMLQRRIVVTFRDWTAPAIREMLQSSSTRRRCKPLREHHMANLTEMSRDQLLALVAQMQAAPAKRLTCKVSEKGALSVYGLGRFPVTLYAGQWERLFAAQDEIKAFASANTALLATKP